MIFYDMGVNVHKQISEGGAGNLLNSFLPAAGIRLTYICTASTETCSGMHMHISLHAARLGNGMRMGAYDASADVHT